MAAFALTLLGFLAALFIFNEVYPLSAQLIRYVVVIGAITTLLVFFFGSIEGTRMNRFVGGALALAVLLVGGFLAFGVFEPVPAGFLLVSCFGIAYAVRTQYSKKKQYLDDNGNPIS